MNSKRLYILRHAKSSWDEFGLPDHDRPLAKRGRRAAKAIARHLREQDVVPELVLCSTALRARETFERVEPVLMEPDVRYESELYGAGAWELMERLRAVPDEVGSVMLIGHNPGLEDLVVALAGPEAIDDKFPTAALATLAVSAWSELAPGTAELIAVVRPRELA